MFASSFGRGVFKGACDHVPVERMPAKGGAVRVEATVLKGEGKVGQDFRQLGWQS
jgi:hypothetical protein